MLGEAASSITCGNAPWASAECSDASTSCQRIDDYMWQCLPTSDSTEAPSEVTIDALPADDEAAQPLPTEYDEVTALEHGETDELSAQQ